MGTSFHAVAHRPARGAIRTGLFVGVVVFLWLAQARPALAQRMVTQQVPLRGVSDSFFERNGVSANFRAPGFNLNLGGFQQAIPPFGGFQPGAGAVGGFSVGGGKFRADIGFEFSQGSRRSMVSQTPVITNMDGQTGIFQDITQSPFVISTQPIVPLRPGVPWKLQWEQGNLPPRQTTRADDAAAPAQREDNAGRRGGEGGVPAADARTNRPILSVAEIRRQRQAADNGQNEDALAYFHRGEQAQDEGKSGVAKIHYQMALRRASGELKQRIEERLTRLKP